MEEVAEAIAARESLKEQDVAQKYIDLWNERKFTLTYDQAQVIVNIIELYFKEQYGVKVTD